MHTWALFSFSGLMTLAAYNVAQSPQILKVLPGIEPEPNGESASDETFDLANLNAESLQLEPSVSLPPLPGMPQLSKPDKSVEQPGALKTADYGRAQAESAPWSGEEDFDLQALLEADEALIESVEDFDFLDLLKEDAALFSSGSMPTYRVETVRPALSSIPVPDVQIPASAAIPSEPALATIPIAPPEAPEPDSGVASPGMPAIAATPVESLDTPAVVPDVSTSAADLGAASLGAVSGAAAAADRMASAEKAATDAIALTAAAAYEEAVTPADPLETGTQTQTPETVADAANRPETDVALPAAAIPESDTATVTAPPHSPIDSTAIPEAEPTAATVEHSPLSTVVAPELPKNGPAFTPSPPAPSSSTAVANRPLAATPSPAARLQGKPAEGLFAPLPQVQIPSNTMAAAVPADLNTVATAATPTSNISMRTQLIRYRLSAQCAQLRAQAKEANSSAVCAGDTNELAQRMPEAATAGTPMPGNVLSPTLNNPAMGVLPEGNTPVPVAIAGP